MRLILLIGLVLMTGCDDTYSMTKPSVSQEQVHQDQDQCQQQLMTNHYKTTGAVAAAGSSPDLDLIECMESRGYTVKMRD